MLPGLRVLGLRVLGWKGLGLRVSGYMLKWPKMGIKISVLQLSGLSCGAAAVVIQEILRAPVADLHMNSELLPNSSAEEPTSHC